MELLLRFWEAVVEVDPGSSLIAEADRFRDVCAPEPLRALFTGAGLEAVETRAIDVPTVFRDFEDYWTPFLGGQGPAPAYLASIPEERRNAIRERVRRRRAVDHGWQQICRAVQLGDARAGAQRGGDVFGAGLVQPAVDLMRDPARDVRIDKRGDLGLRIVGGAGHDLDEPARDRFGDLAPVGRRPDA